MMRISAAAIIASATLIALPACSDDTTSPADFAGLYGLTEVDGEDLPVTTDSTATAVI